MNKILSFLVVLLLMTTTVLANQITLKPLADPVQYVPSTTSTTLADLTIETNRNGMITWYADAALTREISASTAVEHGETYYVTYKEQTCATSKPTAITVVFAANVEFEVTSSSCIDLGGNAFFIEAADLGSPVEVKVNDGSGNPLADHIEWSNPSSNLSFEYEYLGTWYPSVNFPFPSSPFPSSINHVRFTIDTSSSKIATIDLKITDAGGATTQKTLTIIAGGLTYNDMCYGDSRTLQDVYTFIKPTINNLPVTWYDAATGGTQLANSTAVTPGTTYYADFGDPNCNVRIPVKVKYKVPAPVASDEYLFCSKATWAKIGVNKEETLADMDVCGANLQWYDSSMNPIQASTKLVDGTTYYVTDEINGCKSAPLKIKTYVKTCGCMEDEEITKITKNDPKGFDFKIMDYTYDACSIGRTTPSTGTVSLGQTNGMRGGNLDNVVVTTAAGGIDPILATQNISLPVTSPFSDDCSSKGIRLNNAIGSDPDAISARKKFVAGEILTFDFASFLENPANHAHDEQPFFQVNIYDSQGNLIQKRCIVSNPDDCIFHYVGSFDGYSDVLYSEWSTVILDTREIRGEVGTVEFIASWCTLSGHAGYVYVDNVFVGDEEEASIRSGSQSFGYLSMETLDNGANVYNDCSLMEMNTSAGFCQPILPALNPDLGAAKVEGHIDFPVSNCGSPQVGSIKLYLIKDGVKIDSINQAGVSNLVPGSSADLSFDFMDFQNASLQGKLYGRYTLKGVSNFMMNQGPNQYNYQVTALNSGFVISPIAACVEDMAVCLPQGANPSKKFTLTKKTDSILRDYPQARHGDFVVTYYASETDARTRQNAITNYTATSMGSTTIYARVDFDWNNLTGLDGQPMDPEYDVYDLITFDVIISQAPEVPTNPIVLEQCEAKGSSDNSFDLNSTDLRDSLLVNVSGTKADYSLEFYTDKQGAQNATAAKLIDTTGTTGYVVTQTGTTSIWARLISPGNCTSVYKVDLVVNPLPTLKATEITISQCADGTGNNTADFDLPVLATPNIVDASKSYDVSYYADKQEAEVGDLADVIDVSQPYNGTGGDTIYARVVNPKTGCFVLADVILDAVEAPVIGTLADYELCDQGSGKATFDLSTYVTDIQNGNANLTVDFYASQADANNQQNAIPTQYKTGSTTIYVRVAQSGMPCAAIAPINLIVNPLPEVPTQPVSMEQCAHEDGSPNGFNLEQANFQTSILANVTGAQSDYSLGFYTTKNGAQVGNAANAIDVTVPYDVNQTTTLWVRIVDVVTGCANVTPVDLIVNPLPSINSPVELRICGDGKGNGTALFNLNNATAFMIGQNANYTVTYYESQPDANAGGAPNALPAKYTNTTPYDQTIYARVEVNATGCYIVEPVDLHVDQAPEANTPAPLTYCDDNNDGVGKFYLPDVIDDITTDPNADVSFHWTKADAENDFGALTDTIYNNQRPGTTGPQANQSVWARVSIPGVGCYTVVEVELIVSPTPDLMKPTEPLAGCDADGDGYYSFDLTSKVDNVVLQNIKDPSKYTITYYADQQAWENDSPINAPSAYTSATGSVIVVVTNKTTGCSSWVEIDLVVSPLPEAYSAHLELCDVNNPGDEKEFFDLHQADSTITGGDASFTVTYYDSQFDADNATDTLVSPYENTVNNQTIYVRVENEFGCVVTDGISLTLIVNPLPNIDKFDTYKVCDIDNDGFADFYLGDFTDQIKVDQPNVEVSYHLTKKGAELNNQTIDPTQPYQNSSPDQQEIWIRAVNTETGCMNIGPLVLKVVEGPEIQNLEDLYVCDDGDDNGFAYFDLTLNDSNVFGGQPAPKDVVVNYYESQANAEADTLAIAVPSNYMNAIAYSQTIYVRVEDTVTGCYDSFDYPGDNSFTINVEKTPVLESTYLAVCDNGYDKDPYPQAVFDLSKAVEDLTGSSSLPNYQEIAYYADSLAMANGNPIQNPFEYVNTANPQDVYVTVTNTNTENACSAHAIITLEVLPLPSPSETNPDELRLVKCDDDTDGVAATPFDLTISGAKIAGGENVDITYYKREGAAHVGDTTSTNTEYISTPQQYVNEPSYNTINERGQVSNIQIIYARVESGAAGNHCYIVVPFEIKVVPQPILNPDGAPFGYTLCEDGSTGQASLPLYEIAYNLYDYTNGTPADLISLLDEDTSTNQGQSTDLNDYKISYYKTKADAEAGTNPIQPGYVAVDGETIYVRVENIESGCYNSGNIGEIKVTVEPRPAINKTTIVADMICSDEPGGTYATIDLTQFDAQVNPGSPADTKVIYYANLNDYNNSHPIEDPTQAYLFNGQTVIAEVMNTVTLCASTAYVQIEIQVEQSPKVDLSAYDGMVLCVDLAPVVTPTEGLEGSMTLDTGLPEQGYTFVWTLDDDVITDATGPSLEITEAGTYSVTVTNTQSINSCSTTSTATILEHNPPEFTVKPTDMAFSDNGGVQVSNIRGNGDYVFRIDDGPWQKADDGQLTFRNLTPGEHYVYGRDLGGCGITMISVSLIDYPDFFTPNGDGINDTWNVVGLKDQPEANVYIFDRYGKLLKQIQPDGPGWDGTFNGKLMPSNDYWFKIEYMQTSPDGSSKHPAEYTGHFTLKR